MAAAMTLALTASLAACSPQDEESGAGGGTIKTVVSADPASFDPALAQGNTNFQAASLLYDTVLRRDDDGQLVGGLATTWEAVSNSEYVFTIREDATFSDGSPVTASTVAASLEHLASAETQSTWRNLVFGTGEAQITAQDDTGEVTITLSEAYSMLPRGLAIAQSGIIGPEGLADLEALAAGEADGAYSGPYTLAEASQGVEYTFALREDYNAWPEFSEPLTGTPAETIVFGIGTDESTVANQVISGDVQFGQFFTDGAASRFTDENAYNISRNTQYTMYLVFNQREGRVFADQPELRAAVAQALDAEQFNTIFTNGQGEVIYSVQPGSVLGASTDESLVHDYDPAAAAAVLDGTENVKFLQQETSSWENINEYVSQQLADTGAEVVAQSVPSTDYWVTLADPEADWDIALIGDLNTLGVISASLDRVAGPSIDDGGRNYGASNNEEANEALASGLATTDQDEQEQYFLDAQTSLLERTDFVPLVSVPGTYVAQQNVTVRVFGDYVDLATLRLTD